MVILFGGFEMNKEETIRCAKLMLKWAEGKGGLSYRKGDDILNPKWNWFNNPEKYVLVENSEEDWRVMYSSAIGRIRVGERSFSSRFECEEEWIYSDKVYFIRAVRVDKED